ncbi:MarR family transcriptional regulator/GNAT family N-acetyltransferase [Clostridium sp. PL3]|uniref:MarR family transcriptional regulator/GNAT family N-acetyltransferase n=1 Tax=Clostridium thailandense TaxID=2794346 RepID=A0A949TXL3_9CLOT|nr:bifunctional helix-turn-helix transcriptional regulator/GNAT family N-acetyltransferase [Clostridium thailandense]MBV7273430.1 MarR family transcriptional regulator/GNAT family N-acetyltransferase [Clostridium thailandense]
MKDKHDLAIKKIRRFNRFYTNVLGLLNQHILDSSYSLTEVRILLEIDKIDRCTANILIHKLDIDRGYMSRILKRFEKSGLITKENSIDDRRMVILHLTSEGKSILAGLEEKSNNQIQKLINPLTEDEEEKLVNAMNYVTRILSPDISPVKIRRFESEDIEHIIKRHRELYALEYGFSSSFGDYVEKIVREFDKNFDESRENIWVAEDHGKVVGEIAIVRVDENTAQLRWFLIEPEMRGKGLGHELMKVVIDFCKEKNYKHVFLWTVNLLGAARHLYKSYGFKLTETQENNTWRKEVTKEERWNLDL